MTWCTGHYNTIVVPPDRDGAAIISSAAVIAPHHRDGGGSGVTVMETSGIPAALALRLCRLRRGILWSQAKSFRSRKACPALANMAGRQRPRSVAERYVQTTVKILLGIGSTVTAGPTPTSVSPPPASPTRKIVAGFQPVMAHVPGPVTEEGRFWL